jgi:hypothetical protein
MASFQLHILQKMMTNIGAIFEPLRLRFPGRSLAMLGSGLIDHNQKMTIAAITMADMKAWAQRS